MVPCTKCLEQSNGVDSMSKQNDRHLTRTESGPLVPTRFTLDTFGPHVVIEGYTRGQLWTGHQVPCFTREQADVVVAAWRSALPDEPLGAGYDDARDEFWFDEAGMPDYFRYGPLPLTTTAGEKLYPIGAFEWTWELATEDA